MKKLRTSAGLFLHDYPQDNMADFIKAGLIFQKNIGFDAVDIPISYFDLSSDDSWKPLAQRVLSDSNEVGIKAELCHLPFSTRLCTEPDFVPVFNQRMHKAIDAAAFLGVDYAVLHPNTTTLPMSKYSKQEQYDSVMSHLSPFVEHANRVGLNIVVENMRPVPSFVPTHRFCQSPEELCDIADALGIGVCWDFGHAHIAGIKQSEALAYVGKRLKVLHINDNFATEDEHIPPFVGNIDWRDAMHGLSLLNFEGLMNFELMGDGKPSSARVPYAQYIIECAKELMSYIE